MSQQTQFKTLAEVLALYPDVEVNRDGGEDMYQEGAVIIERDPIAVVIKHPTENLYLLAKWKKAVWNGFLTGGIEDGDTLEQTVQKEVHEETGYKHVTNIKPLNFATHALFYHVVKKVNRLAHYHLVSAQLADLEKDEVSDEEKNIADFVWVPEAEVMDTITRQGIRELWRYYVANR